MLFEEQTVGAMKWSQTLERRAQSVAEQMKRDGVTSLPIDLFSETADQSDEKGLISMSADELSVPIGSFDLEGTMYYVGLPRKKD